jgi:L-serine dehydratase
LTGRGHATDTAVLLGLMGERPDTVNPDGVAALVAGVRDRQELRLAGRVAVPFHEAADLIFHERESLPQHPNGMWLSAFTSSGELLAVETFFSVGGGFVIREGDEQGEGTAPAGAAPPLPFEFRSAAELLAKGKAAGLSIADMMRRNEQVWRTAAEIDAGLDRIWAAMGQCVERGCRAGAGRWVPGLRCTRCAGCAPPGATVRRPLRGLKPPEPIRAPLLWRRPPLGAGASTSLAGVPVTTIVPPGSAPLAATARTRLL